MKSEDESFIYLTFFNNFSGDDIQLLCTYKNFIKETALQLGEDWRIESNLLVQQANTNQQSSNFGPQLDLFNEFLVLYLKHKIQSSRVDEQAKIQEVFLAQTSYCFQRQNISESLAFKALSIGFCDTANHVWRHLFNSLLSPTFNNPIKQCFFARRTSNIWHRVEMNQKELQNYRKICKQSYQKCQKKSVKGLNKLHVLGNFVAVIQELSESVYLQKGGRCKIRLVNCCNEFYKRAFIIWIIFNIRALFCEKSVDLKTGFSKLMGENWKENLGQPLLHFQKLLEKSRNLLLKECTVAMFDNTYFLKALITRVREQMLLQWEVQFSGLMPQLIDS